MQLFLNFRISVNQYKQYHWLPHKYTPGVRVLNFYLKPPDFSDPPLFFSRTSPLYHAAHGYCFCGDAHWWSIFELRLCKNLTALLNRVGSPQTCVLPALSLSLTPAQRRRSYVWTRYWGQIELHCVRCYYFYLKQCIWMNQYSCILRKTVAQGTCWKYIYATILQTFIEFVALMLYMSDKQRATFASISTLRRLALHLPGFANIKFKQGTWTTVISRTKHVLTVICPCSCSWVPQRVVAKALGFSPAGMRHAIASIGGPYVWGTEFENGPLESVSGVYLPNWLVLYYWSSVCLSTSRS